MTGQVRPKTRSWSSIRIVIIEPLLMDRGLVFLTDSNVQRLTLNLTEQSPDINFWASIAVGRTNALNCKVGAELEVTQAGRLPTDQ